MLGHDGPVSTQHLLRVTRCFLRGTAGTDVTSILSCLSQLPQTLILVCCYLLLQNVELFKKTFNFLCCYSVAIVN